MVHASRPGDHAETRFGQPADDDGPVSAVTMSVHRVVALDRFAVEPADHANPARRPAECSFYGIDTLRLDVKPFHASPSPECDPMSEAPTNIRARQSEQVLELSWPDSVEHRLPYHYLRGECPCASCRDEWTGERIIQPDSLRPTFNSKGWRALATTRFASPGTMAIRRVSTPGKRSADWRRIYPRSRDSSSEWDMS